MTALPNPFETSPAPTSQAVEPAVAPNTPPCAAAGLIEVSPGDVISSLPNGESDPSVTLDCAPGESSSCGDSNADLSILPESTGARSVSSGSEGERRTRGGMQNLHEGKAPGQPHALSAETNLQSGEGAGARSSKGRGSRREDTETDRLSGLQYANSPKATGRPSSGLLKAIGSNLALPILSRRGASNLETDRVTAADQACGSTESRSASALRRKPAKIRSGLPRDFPIQPRAGLAPGPQDQFPPGFDPEKFIEACLKTDDPMPLFLAAPRKEYLAIMGERG